MRGLRPLVALVLIVAGGLTGTADAAARTRPLQLVLPLVADQSGLHAFATAVTTPGSPQYADYASIPTLARRFGASAATRARVTAFLRGAGARDVRIDATGLFADATLPAARAERLFHTSLAEFHAARATYTAPATPVTIPPALRGAVTGVVGLDTRALATAPALLHASPAARFRKADQPPSGYSCSPSGACQGPQTGCAAGVGTGGFTPNQYLTAYGYDGLHGLAGSGEGERVALIEIDGFREGDISTFASCFGLRLPPIDAFGVGVSKALPPGGESTLDLEVLTAAAPGLKSIDVYESNPQASDVLMALTAPLQNSGFKPQVISASLGLCERQTAQAVGRSGLSSAESALQEAAASGISVLAASGDDGSSDCVDSSSQSALPEPTLAVNYPASSPWTTGVGGTNLTFSSTNTIAGQTVWNDAAVVPGAAGGGGTSELFNRPSYQTGTVAGGRREVPDVALLADVAPGYDVYCTASPDCVGSSGSSPWQTVGGTSAATPLLAGGLAVIDELLRKAKQQSVGLPNPMLYSIGRNAQLAPYVFSDVTTGNNDVGPWIQSSGQPLGCCSAGGGYDEASGWGGVNVFYLAKAAQTLQPKIVNVSLAVAAGQQPVRARHVFARVSCDGPCLIGALTKVAIGNGRPFTDYSSLYHLAASGTKVVTVSFSRGQLARLRAALRTHTRITAQVTGAIVDAGGNIEKRTPAKTLLIRG